MISDLKELEKLLKICRKQGVTDIEVAGVKIKLGDIPEKPRHINDPAIDTETDDPYANFPGGILSNSQLAFYSSGGVPDEDPENSGVEQ